MQPHATNKLIQLHIKKFRWLVFPIIFWLEIHVRVHAMRYFLLFFTLFFILVLPIMY